MRSLYGSLAASKVMPPVNVLQGSIVCGFYTIFHDEEGLAVELLEIVKEGCVDTIRSGANHNPYHIIYRQSFVKNKTYLVELDRELMPLHQQMIADFGINLPDGISKLGLTRLDDTRKAWQVNMSEGRNRQIRRTFDALGYKVTKLHRIEFGPYQLGDLPAGKFKEINF